MIAPDLIARLRERAAEPETRHDAPWSHVPANTMMIGTAGGGSYLFNLDGKTVPEPGPLAATATDEEITAAETALGFELPEDLKQLYRSVANGGFGPHGGLAPLASITESYRSWRKEAPNGYAHEWPEKLLPICLTEPGANCYDLSRGEIVFWNEEAFWDHVSEDGESNEADWLRSFEPEADSLAAWLENWLSAVPMTEQLKAVVETGKLDRFRIAVKYLEDGGPKARAKIGLSEENWLEELAAIQGVDLGEL